MTRRVSALIGLASAMLVVWAGPALAHGLGGRVDLPVPRWLFLYGAVVALIVSFVALAILWKEPRLESRTGSRPLPEWAQRIFTGPVAEWAVRLLSLGIFVVVAAAAGVGGDTATSNIAPVFVYVWFWVGVALLHAVLGNLWATLSPWDTLARLLELGDRPQRRYPAALGKWPAAVLLFGFVWMELVFPYSASPGFLAVAIGVYSAITLGGMAVFGREAWNANGECFAVYFGLLARLAPVARDERGRVVLRAPMSGLPSLFPQPGLVPFVAVFLGSTTFDGFSRSSAWVNLVSGLSVVERAALGTSVMLGMVFGVVALYSLAMRVAGVLGRASWRVLVVRFVHSLVPIALAYALAHYFSLLVLEGQLGVILLSDPFGAGWNLFGTAEWSVNLALISANTIWYVQVAAIVAGHIGGVVLAHDRAVAIFPPGRALRTQYALLGVMVAFTMVGLLILSGG